MTGFWMKRGLLGWLVAIWACLQICEVHGNAVSNDVLFEDWFENRTLRMDFVLTGDSVNQQIGLLECSSLDGWAGRHHHLDSLFVKGAGQLLVKDAETGCLIYATSFSTLFQEWQATEEARYCCRSFDLCLMAPMPRRKVLVQVSLQDSRQRTVGFWETPVDPSDILIRRKKGPAHRSCRQLLKSGGPAECVDIAIVGDGYRHDQTEAFYQDAARMCERIFSYRPYSDFKNRFNVTAVTLFSQDEGASEPSKGVWKETALGSSFDTFYSDRYLTTLRLRDVHDALVGIPFEEIIILVNTDKYGGGGIYGTYMLTSSSHPRSLAVCVHELGHSFAGLGDEYDYSSGGDDLYFPDVEPWEKNITTCCDFASKWADMIPRGTPVPTPPFEGDSIQRNTRVGVYEGAGYMSHGVYRPALDCLMRITGAPAFCPVCQRIIRQRIEYLTE